MRLCGQKLQRLSTVFTWHLLYNADCGNYAVLPYICEYFGITPQQFFDDGSAYPVQLADLVEDMKKLDAASLEHIAAIVKEMVGNK